MPQQAGDGGDMGIVETACLVLCASYFAAQVELRHFVAAVMDTHGHR